MKNRYTKLYFEKYAALSLAMYLNISQEDIILSDRPDLRIPKKEMGIEVSQAMKDEVVFSIKKENLYSSYLMNPFDLKAILEVQKESIEDYFVCIDKAIKRKLEKSKHYVRYVHNGLYIFTHCNQFNEDMIRAFFNQHVYQNTFYDEIYLNAIQCLYIYHCKQKKISVFHYDLNDLLVFNQSSLWYEQNKQKE
ncbi:MAG: hypothetical protein EOM50_00025 [Erysipelotrichia bacterium]|nr:hypothetical protein [Erysipelotrichia bacterium]NCC55016.1 hypothetical protein [Erysipelotrichia bacterium]